MYIKRTLENFLAKALSQFPACLITGPRQAGKSTLLQTCLKNHAYVSLDDPFLANMAKEDPELFLSSHPAPVIIDEIQYAPELLRYLKILIDKDRRSYGQYVLTGSQVFSLMQGVSESLAGRIAIFQLYPFSSYELKFLKDQSETDYMLKGFYPEFYVNPTLDRSLWFSSYIATYIERDVRNLKAITDMSSFQKFISLLAVRAGGLLNMSEIGKECGISQPTVKSWLSILESTYLIYLLRPFHNNLTKRLVKSPKVYFVDSGLLAYLLGVTTKDQLLRSPYLGNLFENMVIMDKVKHMAIDQPQSQLFFYRTASGVEVDLIVQRGIALEAYEIKFAKTPSKKMATPLTQFMKDHSCEKGEVLSLIEKRTPLTQATTAVHWSCPLT